MTSISLQIDFELDEGNLPAVLDLITMAARNGKVQTVTPTTPTLTEAPTLPETPTEAPTKTPTEAPKEAPEIEPDTASRVRAIIEENRKRVFGDDYESNPIYAKLRRNFNQNLKSIAAFLGYEKPTMLPASMVDAFRRDVESLKISDDGEAIVLDTPLPF